MIKRVVKIYIESDFITQREGGLSGVFGGNLRLIETKKLADDLVYVAEEYRKEENPCGGERYDSIHEPADKLAKTCKAKTLEELGKEAAIKGFDLSMTDQIVSDEGGILPKKGKIIEKMPLSDIINFWNAYVNAKNQE